MLYASAFGTWARLHLLKRCILSVQTQSEHPAMSRKDSQFCQIDVFVDAAEDNPLYPAGAKVA